MGEATKEVVLVTQGVDITIVITTIVTAVITFVAGLLVNRQGRKQFFSTIVSKERMEWIKEMRASCTELCTICELKNTEEELTPDELKAFHRAKNSMILHLNSIQRKEQIDEFPIDKELYDMLSEKNYKEIQEKIPDIRDKATIIFKAEWDKVKVEAGNNPATVEKIENIQKNVSKSEPSQEEKGQESKKED